MSPTPVEEVAAALRLLEAHAPLPEGATIEVDLSLARGLRYYTGLVFEIYVDTDEGPLQVAGGGRYDDLVRALGGRESVPACGFSYGLERIFLATPAPSSSPEPTPKRVLVVGVTSEDHPHALGIARELRTLEGVIVEQDVRLRGVKAALRHADRAEVELVAIVGERERAEGTVVLRSMRTREESSVPREQVLGAARGILNLSALRLALPSKAWEDDTLRFLGQCGLRIDRSNPRQYRARMHGLPTGPAEVVFQRATDIFEEVNGGTVDLGITGYDIVAEHRAEEDDIVVVHAELGFRRCALVVAVPEGWVDVSSVSDLAEIAVELRSAGRELRVATKYANLTRQFLYDRGITYFALIEVSGAIEAAPALETADIICDLTSSGVTLRENRLKPISGGTVVESQACLIGNRRTLMADASRLEATRGLLELIEAFLRSRRQVSITANIRGESAEAVARRVTASGVVGGLRGPTVARVFPKDAVEEGEWFALTVIVAEDVLLPAVESLRRAGASEITATQVRYVFEHRSWTFEALKRQLAAGRPGGPGYRPVTAWPRS